MIKKTGALDMDKFVDMFPIRAKEYIGDCEVLICGWCGERFIDENQEEPYGDHDRPDTCPDCIEENAREEGRETNEYEREEIEHLRKID